MNEVEQPKIKKVIELKGKLETIRGLMRPFVTVALVSTAIYLALKGKIEAEAVWAAVTFILGHYFGERAALKKPNN